jgi:DNA-binding XRE family transcriptional regulator
MWPELLVFATFFKNYGLIGIVAIFTYICILKHAFMDLVPIRIHDVKKEVGQWVKKMRTSRKLTQIELAERLNLSRLTIQNIEHGNNFTIDTLLLILQHFDALASFREFVQNKMEDLVDKKSFYPNGKK